MINIIFRDIRELKTGRRELRSFGLLVGGVFLALGLFFLFRQKSYALWVVTPGVVLMLLGLIFPPALRHIYIAWMSLAVVLGFIVSHVILAVFFFLVVTPIGLLSRVVGKDFLRLKLERNATTYWMPREPRKDASPEHYEQQF